MREEIFANHTILFSEKIFKILIIVSTTGYSYIELYGSKNVYYVAVIFANAFEIAKLKDPQQIPAIRYSKI